MRILPVLTLSLLAGIVLAESPASTESPPPQQPPAAAPVNEPTPPEYDFSEERALYHNPVQSILVFVHDKTSADAAASRVKQLQASLPTGAEPQVAPESWLYLYFGSGCFGSMELMNAMRPLQPKVFAAAERFRVVVTPFLDELGGKLDSLTALMEQVNDADSAHMVTEALNALPSYMDAWLAQTKEAVAQAMAETTLSRDDMYFTLALEQIYPLPAVSRLRQAYGYAQSRVEGGSPTLAQAMQKVWEPLENMTGVTLAPNTITPEALEAEVRLGAALHEWMKIAATVTDTASADAAADWLVAQGETLGQPIMQAALTATSNGGSYTAFLSVLQEALHSYFELATPAWFGSAKLQQALEADEGSLMPVPEVLPLREEGVEAKAE